MSNVENLVFDVLKKTAMADGIMTAHESQLIAIALKDSIAFDRYLKMAKKDGFIDIEERENLLELLNKIYEGAQEQALKDDYISTEEVSLLVKLSEFIKSVMDTEKLE